VWRSEIPIPVRNAATVLSCSTPLGYPSSNVQFETNPLLKAERVLIATSRPIRGRAESAAIYRAMRFVENQPPFFFYPLSFQSAVIASRSEGNAGKTRVRLECALLS
jgi:hypothetical protein